MGETYLLHRLASGDATAMTACVEQYGNLIWSLALRFLKDQRDAEDAVQDIFIHLWETAAKHFDPTLGKEATFVAVITRRRLIDRMRKRGRRESKHDDGFDLNSLKSFDHRRVEATSDVRRAAHAIAELPDERRSVVALSVVDGMTQNEIAKQLSMPIGTVKSHLRRGLLTIRERMKGRRAEVSR